MHAELIEPLLRLVPGTQLLPGNDFDAHGVYPLLDIGVCENKGVITSQKVAAGDCLQFIIVIPTVNDHLCYSGLELVERVQISFLS
jgi:hypothetical protein